MPTPHGQDTGGQASRDLPARVLLGLEIRHARMARGLSQRELAHRIGLSAHSNIVDYELGRRLPPTDIVTAVEKALRVSDHRLRRLHAQAMDERARRRLRDTELRLGLRTADP